MTATNPVAARYQILAPLGAGGMAKIYRALDQEAGREVALKVMSEHLLGDPEAQRRFKAEQRVMASLDHPGVPAVGPLGLTAEGLPFFAMELIEGESLEQLGPIAPEEARALMGEFLPILAHLHARGLVHGDLKGENLMRTRAGRLKLMDYGLAGPAGPRPNGLEGTVTHVGPELIQRGKADARTDLYAAGVMLYRFLTGRLPLEGASASETLKLQATTVPASPRSHVDGLDPALDALVMRLLAKRPQDRPQSAGEVLTALGFEAPEDDAAAMPMLGPFVGRQALMGDLLGAVAATAQGQAPAPTLLAGAPGLGKSRTLEELGAQARLMDLPVAAAQCPPDQVPFGPFIDLARDLLALARQAAPEAASALQQALAPFTSGASAEGADASAALKAALARALEAAATRGLVVLLDDWHRADAASVALLEQLVKAPGKPIFWLAAATPAEPPASFPGPMLTIAPMGASEVAAMVAANLAVETAPAPVVEAVAAAAAGAPRVIEELLRYMRTHKQLVRRQGGWVLAEGAAGELPSGLQALYAARVADLAPETRRLAETLALAACPLSAAVAGAASGLSTEAAEAAAADLIARQLVSESSTGLALLDGQLAAWLGAQLEGEAVARHGALASALAAEAGERPSLRMLNALAHHGMRGPEPASALPHLEAAARQNLELKSLAPARRFAQAALDLAGDRPARERLELLELLSGAMRGLDDAEGALAVANEAVGLAESLEDAAVLARALNGLGKVHQLASRYDEAKAAFERAIEVGAGGQAPLELARSHRAIARVAFFAGDTEATYRHGKEALALARRHAAPAERAEVLAEIGEMFQGEEDRTYEGLMCLEEAQTLAQELQNSHLESTVAAGLGNLQLSLGQLAVARASFERASQLFEAIGNAGEALFARLNLALIAVEQGYFPEAETLAAGVGAEAKAANRKFPMAVAWCVEGAAKAHQGRTAEGLKLMGEAANLAVEIKHGYLRAIIRQFEAPLRALLGQWEAARAEAKALGEFGESAHVSELIQRARLVEAACDWQQGALVAASERIEPLLNVSHAAVRLEAQLLRAQVALARRDEPTAHQALHAARALLDEVDAPLLAAEFSLVEALLAQAAGEEAVPHAQAAVDRLEATQARHALVRALAVLAELSQPREQRTALARAQELLAPLAAALGEEAGAYMAAYGRQPIAEASAVPPESAGPVPTTVAGLKALLKRLEQGLDQVEKQGFGTGDSVTTQRRLNQVVEFAKAIHATLDVGTVVDRALNLIIEVTGAERGLLLFKDADGLQSQRYLAAPGLEAEAASGEQYSRTVARTVIETGEPVCVLDALSDSRFAQQASVMGLNLQTIICVPLKEQGETIGAIYVDRQGLSEQFMDSDLEIVQALASLTAQALTNARLMKQQQERQVHLEMLNRLSRTISRTLELDKVLSLIAEMTLETAQAERVFVLMWENEQLNFGAGCDREGPLPAAAIREISRSVCDKVIETKEGVYVIDTGKDDEFGSRRSVVNLKLGSIVAVPLMGQAGLTGVLYVDSTSRLASALEKELSVLAAIGNTASLAIENARLYRQATVDNLTGLYVRFFFLHRMNEEVRRSQRFGSRFSLLVMDIDHFKRFNDTYGHATGDAVLKVVAATIRNCVRTGLDLPCRYGGEEMVVLLPETEAEGALVTAERIRHAIETASLPGPEGQPLKVTISIGVASFPEMAETAAELFERADQALYASKRSGRNRTTLYDAALAAETS